MNSEKLMKHLRELSEEKFVSSIIKGYLRLSIDEIERLNNRIICDAAILTGAKKAMEQASAEIERLLLELEDARKCADLWEADYQRLRAALEEIAENNDGFSTRPGTDLAEIARKALNTDETTDEDIQVQDE